MRLGEGRAAGVQLLRAAESPAAPQSEATAGGQARRRPRRSQGALQAATGGRALGCTPSRDIMSDAESRRQALVEVYNQASICERCPLSETRSRVVFGAGNADADLMFVGEAPGAEEDRQGLPFVGRAGGLLAELLEGIGMTREDVWITNVLRCRPPGNRDPQPLEIEACQPYTYEQVQLTEPLVVCPLGNFSTKLWSGSQAGITKVRGTPQVHELGGRMVYLLPL